MAAKGGMACDCVAMTGPDDEFDVQVKGQGFKLVNELPARCGHCSFPDIDFVPKTYLLARGVSSPAETWSAKLGNFLVRERVRRILELAVPKACDFRPTAELKSKKATPWSLVVPNRVLSTPGLKPWDPKRCSKCGEPKAGYLFYDNKRNRYVGLDQSDCEGIDVFKSQAWSAVWQTAEERFEEINTSRTKGGHTLMKWSEGWPHVEPPTHKERWTRQGLDRELYFSIRLVELWKKAKVKGRLVVSYHFKDYVPTADDVAWVDEKMALLAKHGLVEAPAGKKAVGKAKKGKSKKTAVSAAEKKAAAAAAKWFQQYLKKNAKKKPAAVDFEAVEKKEKIKLPKSYKGFITKVGSKSFKDVNDMEGSTTKVLPPKQLDFRDYRAGALEDTDEESAAVDGVMFAATDHGDCFVFDISGKGSDYPVFYYNHELNSMEPWSKNFAECIKRFADRN